MTVPAPQGSVAVEALPEPAWVTEPPELCPPPCPPVPWPRAEARRRLSARRRTARKRVRLYAVLAAYRAGSCQDCGEERDDCVMAHVAPSPVQGQNRGKDRRAYDVMHHPEAYRRLCPRCHAVGDPHRHLKINT